MKDLIMHKKTVHEGIKSFDCDQCSKSFGQASHLREHRKIVQGGIEAY